MGVCMFLTTLTFLLSLAPVNVTQEKLLETGFLRIAGDEEDYKPYVCGWYLSTCRPPASCTMAHYANRDRCVRKDLNYTIVRSSPPVCPPTSKPLQIQGFEWYTNGGGVHWKNLTSLMPTLAQMGITALWIPRNSLPLSTPF